MFRSSRSQRGYALITVTVIGLVIMVATAGLITRSVNAEAEAVEADLLRLRAYWAMTGQASYILSRGWMNGLCGGDGFCGASDPDDERFDSFAGYAVELRDSPLVLPAYRQWSYADISDGYFLNVDLNVRDWGTKQDGRFVLELRKQSLTGDLLHSPDDFLARVWPTIQDIDVHICTGLVVNSDPCSDPLAGTNANGGSHITGIYPAGQGPAG